MPAPINKKIKKKILEDYFFHLMDKKSGKPGNYTDNDFCKKHSIPRSTLFDWINGSRENFFKDYLNMYKAGEINRNSFRLIRNLLNDVEELRKLVYTLLLLSVALFIFWPILIFNYKFLLETSV